MEGTRPYSPVKKGKANVEWQGMVQAYPMNQIHFHAVPTFFAYNVDSILWRLLETLGNDASFHKHFVVFGLRGNYNNVAIFSSAPKRFPLVWNLLREVSTDLGILMVRC